ncbi:hypothetical protein PoB_002271200 [Plakobranchus ocellatus]|uniref:Uncharacterized protein n=1 Tax=Plakobranchus ocellatus TaxID=259542 RepID=A0AAV3ZNH8_9GAST|nr:hypothetical protein PoB_002271200 [Plakobranchus ocellatus]
MLSTLHSCQPKESSTVIINCAAGPSTIIHFSLYNHHNQTVPRDLLQSFTSAYTAITIKPCRGIFYCHSLQPIQPSESNRAAGLSTVIHISLHNHQNQTVPRDL